MGVHDALGVEGVLDRSHQVPLDGGLLGPDPVAQELADAVLGAEGAAEGEGGLVDPLLQFVAHR